MIASRSFDVLCCHAAEVGDYRSLDFEVAAALAANTRGYRATLAAMRERGLKAVVATGSVFEQDEGAGPAPRRAFSPYGLSKGLTWQVFRHWGETLGVPTCKFVIANPFGPYEEPRFVNHCVERWAKGETVEVKTPLYVRDNIHVRALTEAYVRFVESDAAQAAPSQYRETQGAFAERFARELEPRLGVPCRLELREQTDFFEPLELVNTEPVDGPEPWDELASWYRR